MIQEFVIEDGIPLPTRSSYRRRVGQNGTYPFDRLQVGQSFVVRGHGMRGSLSGLAVYWARKTGFRFATRNVAGGVRIWRVA